MAPWWIRVHICQGYDALAARARRWIEAERVLRQGRPQATVDDERSAATWPRWCTGGSSHVLDRCSCRGEARGEPKNTSTALPMQTSMWV